MTSYRLAGASALLLGLLSAVPAMAQESGIPGDASNFYKSDRVTMQPVTFPNQYKMIIAGDLFVPKGMNPGQKHAAIIVGHPMGAVKEQSACLYATKMAEQGFVTLAVDLSFWGGSSGQPHNAVSPDLYAAAKIDPRLRAIATVSMYDMGTATRSGLGHSLTPEDRKAVLREAADQRWVEAEGGQTKYTGGTVHKLTEKSTPIEREFYAFYRTPRGEFTPKGASPLTTTHPTLTSNVKFMNFYPFNDIETISPRPLLFIAGEKAHSREFSEDAYQKAAEPKELLIVPGAGHVDLYDRVNLIPFAKLTSFFRQALQ